LELLVPEFLMKMVTVVGVAVKVAAGVSSEAALASRPPVPMQVSVLVIVAPFVE
jgi:hypothetical protein